MHSFAGHGILCIMSTTPLDGSRMIIQREAKYILIIRVMDHQHHHPCLSCNQGSSEYCTILSGTIGMGWKDACISVIFFTFFSFVVDDVWLGLGIYSFVMEKIFARWVFLSTLIYTSDIFTGREWIWFGQGVYCKSIPLVGEA